MTYWRFAEEKELLDLDQSQYWCVGLGDSYSRRRFFVAKLSAPDFERKRPQLERYRMTPAEFVGALKEFGLWVRVGTLHHETNYRVSWRSGEVAKMVRQKPRRLVRALRKAGQL